MAVQLNLGYLITFLKWILKIGGLWKPKVNGIWSRLYIVYSVCFIFTFSVMYTAFMCANLYFLRDISQSTEMLFMSMMELALVLKIINFHLNNSKLQLMLHRMREFQMENESEQSIMRSRLTFLTRQTIIYYIFANMSLNTSATNAAISDSDTLIYSAYYPGIDWRHNTVDYWYTFAYQYFGMIFTTYINLAIDSYFCIMMYLLSGQIIILGNRLSNVGTSDGMKRKTAIQQRLLLIKHIQTHNEIVEFIQNIENCLWWSFFGQLVLSTIAIGSVVNEILRVSGL